MILTFLLHRVNVIAFHLHRVTLPAFHLNLITLTLLLRYLVKSIMAHIDLLIQLVFYIVPVKICLLVIHMAFHLRLTMIITFHLTIAVTFHVNLSIIRMKTQAV